MPVLYAGADPYDIARPYFLGRAAPLLDPANAGGDDQRLPQRMRVPGRVCSRFEGGDVRMAVVGAPDYFSKRTAPEKPQDLTAHDCINVRLPTDGGLLPWNFKKRTRELNVRVEGQMTFKGFPQAVDAAVAGLGLAFVLEDVVKRHIADGRLVRVLEDWCEVFPEYHLYYPSRRQPSLAFALVVDALRYRE